MFKQTFTTATLGAILSGSLASGAIAAPQDFVGTWVNTDANTSGITRFTVTPQGGGGLRIQVFGKCHPTDCDWGSATLFTYGNSVQDPDHTAGIATYTPSFARNFLTLQFRGSGRNQINLQGFTQFTDNSGRQNYFTQDTFKRTSRLPKLVFRGTEFYSANGRQWVRYKLAIENSEIFPSDLFVAAPNLPPCGLNNNASRTWVDIVNSDNNQRLYGFCNLSSPQNLDSLWFAVERGARPPRQVHVVLTDRRTNTAYRSNSVVLR